MALAPDEREHRISRFKEALQRAGVKLIHQRFEIFSEVVVTSPSVWAPFIGSSVSMVSEPLPSGSPSAR